MAVAGVKLSIGSDSLRGIADEIKAFFPKEVAADVLGDIIEKAIWPAFLRLREVTPVGPTGNLKRAVDWKVVKYKANGAAVGLIGYQRAGAAASQSAAGGSVRSGKDRGFHQWWLEFGTKERRLRQSPKPREYQRRSPTEPFIRTRTVNGKAVTETVRGKGVLHSVFEQTPTYIASSFNKLGPFEILSAKAAKGQSKRVQTDPAYPNAYFRKSKSPIVIPAMPAGGTSGQPPVQTAWAQTQGQVAEYLQRELKLTLGQAWEALTYKDSGSITGA